MARADMQHDLIHVDDPITTAAQLISSLYQNLPRSIDSRTPAVFTIGQIAAGQAPNVVPEIAELRGSLRSTNDHARSVLHKTIEENLTRYRAQHRYENRRPV